LSDKSGNFFDKIGNYCADELATIIPIS
jgi:hypothetical protein